MGVERVQTSGQQPTALAGASRIREWVNLTGVEILPAGGIGPGNVAELLSRTGCDQVHGSFRRHDSDDETLQFNRSLMAAMGDHRTTDATLVTATRHAMDE
jgi:copper homeostasis protein